MTKKLYLYNNICYNECPYGSIKDEISSTCKEINKYTKEVNISQKSYIMNQKEYILEFLGDKYARETCQFIRSEEFTVYHHKINNITDNIEKKKDLKIPIFDFTECITELKKNFNLSDSENIYIEIIENNNEQSILNKTNYQFFKDDGSLLNHSCCYNKNIIVMKNINLDEIDYLDLLKYFNELEYNITDLEIFDYCIPLSINGSDYILPKKNIWLRKLKNYVRKVAILFLLIIIKIILFVSAK